MVYYLEERARLRNLNLIDDLNMYLAIILFIATDWEKTNLFFFILNQ